MAQRRPTRRQLEERLRMTLQLINDSKVSKEKKVELQVEYCFLQRELEFMKYKTSNKQQRGEF